MMNGSGAGRGGRRARANPNPGDDMPSSSGRQPQGSDVALPPLRERRITLGHVPLRILSPADPHQLIDHALDEMAAAGDDPGDDINPPYWADVWPAAIALGRRLLKLPLAGARVLELGTGLGLAGLAAARAGARVTLTDREPCALEIARRNAQLNELEVEIRLLDWGGQPAAVGCFDWVIGADVIYEEALVEPLSTTLAGVLAGGGRGLIADPMRPYRQLFTQALTARGLHSNLQSTHFYWDGQARTVTLIEIKR
jgi:predicted nicotinamide N-methyase